MLTTFRRIVDNRWFSLFDLALVFMSGVIVYYRPGYSGWPILIALLPWVIRLAALRIPFQRTPYDFVISIFVIAAGIGWWAAYDLDKASHKFWLIICAILLFYALAGQPKKNWFLISAALYTSSVVIALFFLLGHNYQESPAKYEILNRIGLWWSELRPSWAVPTFSQDDASGLILLTAGFGVFAGIRSLQSKKRILLLPILFGYFIIASALLLATSRGAWFAIPGALGVIVLYQFFRKYIHFDQPRDTGLFIAAVILYSLFVTLGLFFLLSVILPPGGTESVASPQSGIRLELFRSAFYLLRDYPFTGGGLESFAGLYTRYILGIQPFYLNSSHNLFLDIAVEQGIPGIVAYAGILIYGIWSLLQFLAREHKNALTEGGILGEVIVFSMFVVYFHGTVDDYLYRGLGTLLMLFLAGMSVSVCSNSILAEQPNRRYKRFAYSKVVVASAIFVVVVLIGVNGNAIRAAWYANLGALSMGRVELANYPEEIIVDPKQPLFQQSQQLLTKSLSFDPENFTALYRLGIINFYQDDFPKTIAYMEQAWQQSQSHRIVRKYMGYAYAWQGEYDEAANQLSTIPEALYEMELYTWWWGTQGRDDLSSRSAYVADLLRTYQAK